MEVCADDPKGRPAMVLDYNTCKGGVDTMCFTMCWTSQRTTPLCCGTSARPASITRGTSFSKLSEASEPVTVVSEEDEEKEEVKRITKKPEETMRKRLLLLTARKE